MRKRSWPLLILGVGCNNGALFSIEVAESATAEISGSGPLGEVTDLVGNLGFGGFTEMNIVESEELANQGGRAARRHSRPGCRTAACGGPGLQPRNPSGCSPSLT